MGLLDGLLGSSTSQRLADLEERVAATEQRLAVLEGTIIPEPEPGDPHEPATPPNGYTLVSDVDDIGSVKPGSHVVLAAGIHHPSNVPVPAGVTVYGVGEATLDGEYSRDVAFRLADDVTLDGLAATRYNGAGWSDGGTGVRRAQGQAPFKGPADRVTIRAFVGYENRHAAVRVEGEDWRVSGWVGVDNGQHALAGGGQRAVVEYWLWARNGNDSDVQFGETDRGGCKLTHSTGMLLQHGVSEGHNDMGVWADGNNRDLTVVDVEARDNRKHGFNWEVNPGPITMTGCRGFRNGFDDPQDVDPWEMRWSQLFISSSGNVTVDGGEFRGRKGVGVWNDWSHHAYGEPWGDEIGCRNLNITGAVIEGTVLTAGVNVMGSPVRWDVLAESDGWFTANTYVGSSYAIDDSVVGLAGWKALGQS